MNSQYFPRISGGLASEYFPGITPTASFPPPASIPAVGSPPSGPLAPLIPHASRVTASRPLEPPDPNKARAPPHSSRPQIQHRKAKASPILARRSSSSREELEERRRGGSACCSGPLVLGPSVLSGPLGLSAGAGEGSPGGNTHGYKAPARGCPSAADEQR